MSHRFSSASESANDTILRLSDDIGKMADRIGLMADRIGHMADRILETQQIQSENLKSIQSSTLEMMRVMNDQLKSNNELLVRLIDKFDQ